MYVVQFSRADGSPVEEYYHASKSSALAHLALFEHDDSALYSDISVRDYSTNAIIANLVFP